jgi:TetR/AcrR family transcriptional regulator, fatty acid metabolism regulator protein
LHGAGTYHYAETALTDRSIDKRALLLEAAVRVFARKGFHSARVRDVAEEAGVAYGLVYHYFRSKDELLETIFRESWGRLVTVLESLAGSDKPAPERLRLVGAAILRTWRDDPDLVTVLVREIGRSPQLQERIGELRAVFAIIRRVVDDGQASGELRRELDPQLATWIFYGGIEEILTGWVMGQLPDGEDAVARAERTLLELVCGGLAQTRAAVV